MPFENYLDYTLCKEIVFLFIFNPRSMFSSQLSDLHEFNVNLT